MCIEENITIFWMNYIEMRLFLLSLKENTKMQKLS